MHNERDVLLQRRGMNNAKLRGQRMPGSIFFVVVSCLASFYVLDSLWTSTRETEILREKLASLTAVVQQQRSQLEQESYRFSERHDEDVLFYSVRPKTTGDNIFPLEGKRLDASMVVDHVDSHTLRNRIEGEDEEAYSEILLGQLTMIEDGEARGWACRRTSRGGSPTNAVVAVYVDDILIAETVADEALDLPIAVSEMCQEVSEEDESPPGSLPVGFSAKLPILHDGQHTLRAFMLTSGDKLQEINHSPAIFIESGVRPNAEEAIRRKDAIILQRNVEIVSLWNQLQTQLPWQIAENSLRGDPSLHELYADSEGVDISKSTSRTGNRQQRLLGVILVWSGVEGGAQRELVRKTWAANIARGSSTIMQNPNPELEIRVRFLINVGGSSAGRSSMEKEEREHGDLLMPGKPQRPGVDDMIGKVLLAGLAAAVEDAELDADFYIITRDTVVVDVKAVEEFLLDHRQRGNMYVGCLKSGNVVNDDESQWYEPDEWRFGDRTGNALAYPRHSAKEFYALSRPVARHLALTRHVLRSYANEDTTMGAWLLGMDVHFVHEDRFCCTTQRASQCSGKSKDGGKRCLALMDSNCEGICQPKERLKAVYDVCVLDKGDAPSKALIKGVGEKFRL